MSDLAPQERPFTFRCDEAELLGILHLPPMPARRGVVVVVGGPQYRVGSHRQFLLLARSLAARGFPVLRFDHRGVGDSEGPYRGFEALEADLAAAIDAFFRECPGLEDVALWGLCDAASAILFYAHKDSRVAGIALLNPWIRTTEGEARAYLRHYYLHRLAEGKFWVGLLAGKVRLWASASSLLAFIARSLTPGRPFAKGAPLSGRGALNLPDRMAAGLGQYRGSVLLITSGRDLTAREFEDETAKSDVWQGLLKNERVKRHDLPAADHTFSRRAWRDTVADWTADWLRTW